MLGGDTPIKTWRWLIRSRKVVLELEVEKAIRLQHGGIYQMSKRISISRGDGDEIKA